ncbi:Spy/CpxP family protein refolding chaperone [Microbulbifer sp. OS29]|uniref:Spy/CpxP family protein refolding chaperone n=1 Tax=Microbulbifer okhotskensis TaxID=2926617 RepID=A0A9X2ET33_9GAMM|nr:Spy/CpxP family protein refolding chaperone [Microbulbifer okhotskensis]MCO1335058.1 Spy/CpxP family protein refolding chaperone [Microbulbifer okhotskensis]
MTKRKQEDKGMKYWKQVLGSLTLAGVLVAPLTAMAFGGGEGHQGRGFDHMMRQLELTEGQQAQLKANRESTREARMAQRKQLIELRKQISTAIESGADQATLDQLSEEFGKLKVQEMANHKKMREQFKAILTDEQKAKLEQLKSERQESRMKRREERSSSQDTES